jgi:Undecaprenyl-phosphate glucose phosphotransferase
LPVKTRLRDALRAALPFGFSYLAAALDAAVIIAAAYCANSAFGLFTLGRFPPVESVAPLGFAAAALVVGTNAQRREYDLLSCLGKPGQTPRSFGNWNLVFMVALTLGLATKTSSDFSLGATIAFYLLGYVGLAATRRALVDLAQFMLTKGVLAPRRLVIVGFEDRLAEIEAATPDFGGGVDVVSMIALRDHQAYLADDLALAAASVRMYRADDVCLAIPWSRHDLIDSCAAAFLRTPAEIHLDADHLLERYGDARFVRLGTLSGLRITRPRVTLAQRVVKRAFDLLLASAALLALAPVLAVIALLVRLESKGPALFRQTRYGFNQEPFKIFKFRSMRAMEDGALVVAAKREDPRVTRLGAYLRRLSIDELPQLLNVVRGEMSIVGPRPHAMSHDQRYFDRLSRYARRHNVKPGITGWAQVHGHRGEIANDQEMLSRLEHDLYYVENWSPWLDVKIVFLTVFSSKAHRNAF